MLTLCEDFSETMIGQCEALLGVYILLGSVAAMIAVLLIVGAIFYDES